ncbi:hypothetical protein [Actinokineospora pegani]|uniref:hypothetical protein n=1 Tax=Actinokineospora pegani TaxID=2654637 RepID=UPI0012EAC112|nr:hypothetical protein [Actinokineospora pegani]
MPTPHTRLLALAGAAPDSLLVVAREALADGETERMSALLALLTDEVPRVPDFAPAAPAETDAAVVEALAHLPVTACWVALRDARDPVHLVRTAAAADLPAVTAAVQRALESAGESVPRVEVFGPSTPLPDYHEAALLAATLLWSDTIAHDLITEVDERQHLLDYLGDEAVDPVPAPMATLTHLDRHRSAPAPAPLSQAS